MMELSEEKRRFLEALSMVQEEPSGSGGIGTLGEKTLHAVCKLYMEPDCRYHEVKTGSFVADIARDGAIVEIQTRSFNRLREKLSYFLSEGYVVTVVYPVSAIKWLSWMDMEEGTVTDRRKSPKKGGIYDIIPELYKIKPLIAHPNLDFTVLLLEVWEYRMLDGWSRDKKKGSTRYERIPISLVDRVTFGYSDGFAALIPKGLPETFQVREFAKAAGISHSHGSTLLSILHSAGVLERVGKSGRMFLYQQANRQATDKMR
ncbi:MAG: hypothetical protein ACI3YK_00415 [Eubacteriales bacterium]